MVPLPATGARVWMGIATAALLLPTLADAAGDGRFYGTYCGTHREEVSVWVPLFPLLPIPVRRTYHVDLSLRAHADYIETHLGNGLLHGVGRARVESHTLPGFAAHGLEAGDELGFAFTGRVVARGSATGVVRARGIEATSGSVGLSNDGMTVRVRAMDREIALSKLECGNRAPTVTINLPHEEEFPWGRAITFSGSIRDDGDVAAIPDRHKRWLSDRAGLIGTGDRISTRDLAPGPHTITFAVADTGGLTASATKRITISNTPPRVFIDEPNAAGTYYAGAPITFRGHANDTQQGNLTGSSLQWTTGTTRIGTGTDFMAALPAGAHTVRLTATDGISPAYNEVRISVSPCPPAGCPPGVRIVSPGNLSAPVGDESPANCLPLVAEAADSEGRTLGGNALVWTTQADGAPPEELPSRGENVEKCFAAGPGGDWWSTITVTATDRHGVSASDSIRILVIGGPGLY